MLSAYRPHKHGLHNVDAVAVRAKPAGWVVDLGPWRHSVVVDSTDVCRRKQHRSIWAVCELSHDSVAQL